MIEKYRNIEMNELSFLTKERHSSVCTRLLVPRIILHIMFRIELFIFCVFAMCCTASGRGQFCMLVRVMKMLFWQPGSVLGECLSHSLALLSQTHQTNCRWAGCLQLGPMEEGKIFWLMNADVNGLSPSQLKYYCCLANVCPSSGSA